MGRRCGREIPLEMRARSKCPPALNTPSSTGPTWGTVDPIAGKIQVHTNRAGARAEGGTGTWMRTRLMAARCKWVRARAKRGGPGVPRRIGGERAAARRRQAAVVLAARKKVARRTRARGLTNHSNRSVTMRARRWPAKRDPNATSYKIPGTLSCDVANPMGLRAATVGQRAAIAPASAHRAGCRRSRDATQRDVVKPITPGVRRFAGVEPRPGRG
jgi:hypothetical protein